MNRQRSFNLVIVPLVFVTSGILLLCSWGIELSPIAKFFTVFVVAIVGLQSVPAVLIFARKLKRCGSKRVEPGLTQEAGHSEHKCHVLIADRDNDTRKQLEVFFNRSSFVIESTASAASAIAKIAQKNEHLVLLGRTFEEDITPEDVSALMHKCNKNIPIILVSDDDFMETLEQISRSETLGYTQRASEQNGNKELHSVGCSVDGLHPIMS